LEKISKIFFIFKIYMDFIKYKYSIAIASIIILIMVSVHGSMKPPGDKPNKSKKNNLYKPKHLAAIDKKTGLPVFIQKVIMPR
tara:strand:+ start:767 stop:1015 length:249 start_codon:yes stop_codon:yes gene_type:complete